jgi:glycosyltransferase involved in cell wall biosynthesis
MSLPLISCIMPTHNRRFFIPQAIRCFLAQDYPNKELVVLDDGDDPICDLLPDRSEIRYKRITRHMSLGEKRNIACEEARGNLIAHWDDDDWMSPRRLSYQTNALLKVGADICGLRCILYYQPANKITWLNAYYLTRSYWLCGGTLLYTRALWARAPFRHVQVGEDALFIYSGQVRKAISSRNLSLYLAIAHDKNTDPKRFNGYSWSRWSGDIKGILGGDLNFYNGCL